MFRSGLWREPSSAPQPRVSVQPLNPASAGFSILRVLRDGAKNPNQIRILEGTASLNVRFRDRNRTRCRFPPRFRSHRFGHPGRGLGAWVSTSSDEACEGHCRGRPGERVTRAEAGSRHGPERHMNPVIFQQRCDDAKSVLQRLHPDPTPAGRRPTRWPRPSWSKSPAPT